MTSNTKGTIYALIAVFIFGATGVVCKHIANMGVNMCFLGGIRFVIGAITVAIFLASKNSLKLYFDNRILLTISVAVFGLFANFITFQSSLNYIPATISILIESLSPVLVFVLSFIFLRKKNTLNELIALIISLIGVFIVVNANGKLTLFGHNSLGILLAFIAALSWALYIFLSVEVLNPIRAEPIKVLQFLFTVFIIASVCFSPFLIKPYYYPHNFNMWMIIVEVGVVQTGINYIFWSYALSLIPANNASIIFTLTIFLTAINEVIFLNFKLNLYIIVGGILIVVATNLATRKSSLLTFLKSMSRGL